MARYERFTFLCDKDERQMIEILAKRLQRTQSDAMRILIREAVQGLQVINDGNQKFNREVNYEQK